MKAGKITENVYKRSVLKQIKTKKEEVLIGAGIGEDCAIFSFGEEELTAVSSSPMVGYGPEGEKSALYSCVNRLAASGAEPAAVMISGFYPETAEESDIKNMMLRMEEECAKLDVQITGSSIEVTGAVVRPVLSVSGVGKAKKADISSVRNVKSGQDVVVSKWIGLEGTAMIARRMEEQLLTRYPVRLIENAKGFDRFLSIVPEAAAAVKSGVRAMHGVTEGGIFGALWEMSEGAGVGLEIDLKKLPVKQETIEVCEFFEINPYELLSGGCLLMAADNGYDLVRTLEQEGVPAAVVGKTTDNNDRVVINGDEKRFLEPSRSDELFRVL
ncbi:AIR synthase-related protein [Kineothrix sedimenti]|uniref:AIR synthase-related protein n=1 Tax=Kineothrix sedimenti TaxID=3123317 RepID=A0ABZ3EUE1_9FIRM